MKKLLLAFTVLLSGVMIFSSCHSEKMNLGVNQKGQVRLSEMEVTYNTEPLVTVSRAAQDIDNYMIGIYNSSDNTLVQEWKYSEMPEVFTLEVGTYKIIAHSQEVEGAQFDAPYCYGESAPFEVKKDQVTDAGKVECILKGIKVTIKFTDELKALLDKDAKVTVTVADESLVYTADEERSGYFHAKVGTNFVNTEFIAKVDGYETTQTKGYDVKESTELIVTYDLKNSSDFDPNTGGYLQNYNITVNEDIKEIKYLNGTVSPSVDEILDTDDPVIVGDGFDINEPITDLTMNVVVKLMAPEGMKDIIVRVESDNSNFENAVEGIFGKLEFSLMEDELQENLESLGFPTKDEIEGNTGVVLFDITKFVSLLADPAFAGKHTFNIKVIDVNDVSAEAALVIDSSNN